MKFDLTRKIDKIQVPIVRTCNKRCPQCCARHELTWFNEDIKLKEKEISLEELRWAGKSFGKVDYMEITGGEPTLHSDFEELTNNLHDIFDCDDIMLVSNGWLFGKDPSKLPLLLKYTRVWISHYTDQFVERYGGTSNTKECEVITAFLRENGFPTWNPILLNEHTQYKDPPGGIPCGWHLSNMIAYYEKHLYGCCVSWSLPDKGKGIPLTKDWRDHLSEIDLPCNTCSLSKNE